MELNYFHVTRQQLADKAPNYADNMTEMQLTILTRKPTTPAILTPLTIERRRSKRVPSPVEESNEKIAVDLAKVIVPMTASTVSSITASMKLISQKKKINLMILIQIIHFASQAILLREKESLKL